jgi:ParB-like chromosome segregation protein Spo0J
MSTDSTAGDAVKSVGAACGREFHQLANLFKANGLRETIVIHEDKIIDGRNRARACERAGVRPVYRPLLSVDNPLQFVLDKNLQRRHLNESQRALIATKIANMRQGERTDIEPSANLQKVATTSRVTDANAVIIRTGETIDALVGILAGQLALVPDLGTRQKQRGACEKIARELRLAVTALRDFAEVVRIPRGGGPI